VAAHISRERWLTRRETLVLLLGATGSTLAACTIGPGPTPPAGVDAHPPPDTATAPPTSTPPTTTPPTPGGVLTRVPQLRPHAHNTSVALTFDDGPDPHTTPQVLDLLAALGAHASFCVIGSQVTGHETLVRRIAAEGHTIVNHTHRHPLRVARLTSTQLDDEIRRPQAVLGDLLGSAPTLFRCPGGEWSPTVLSAVSYAGLRPLGWSVDSRDWTRPGTATITSRLLLAAAGDIMLSHDGGGDRSQTITALREVIPTLTGRGLTFIPL